MSRFDKAVKRVCKRFHLVHGFAVMRLEPDLAIVGPYTLDSGVGGECVEDSMGGRGQVLVYRVLVPLAVSFLSLGQSCFFEPEDDVRVCTAENLTITVGWAFFLEGMTNAESMRKEGCWMTTVGISPAALAASKQGATISVETSFIISTAGVLDVTGSPMTLIVVRRAFWSSRFTCSLRLVIVLSLFTRLDLAEASSSRRAVFSCLSSQRKDFNSSS